MAAINAFGSAAYQSNVEIRSTRRKFVQVDANTYYIFFTFGESGQAAYVKSVDGGATWSSRVDISPGSGNTRFDIYYQRWNGVSEPNVIHIFRYFNSTGETRGIWYSKLDLTTDELVIDNYLVSAMGAVADSAGGICVARDGSIYVTMWDVDGGQMWRSTDGGTTWTEEAASFSTSTSGLVYMWPDYSSSDPADILAIYWNRSSEQLSVRQYDQSAGAITITEIIATIDLDTTNYPIPLSAVVAQNGHVLVNAWNGAAGASTDLLSWDVYGATVTARTDVLTNAAYGIGVASSIDAQDRWWVWYGRDNGGAAASSMEIYYKRSTDYGVTWSSETLHNTQSGTVRHLFADPVLRVAEAKVIWAEGSILYIEGDGVSVDPDQYRLMLSDGADPDIPILNITPLNVGRSGAMLTRFERGRERAVLGEPPRAGSLSTRLKNDEDALGYTGAPSAAWTMDEPTPGLAVRLNKSLDGGTTWYHLAQGNIDSIKHAFGEDGFRSIIDVRANGPFTKLSGKRISTALYSGITTGAAIEIILEQAGFPAHLRDIATGVVTLDWWWLSDADAMSSIVQLVNTEGLTASLYEQGDGKVVFRDRNARYTSARSGTSQATFTSEGSEPRFTGFEYQPGYREIVNEASATRYRLTVDPSPSSTTIWEDADGISYIVPPNGTLVVKATTTLPASGVITPVSGTDYTVGLGSATASLNRVSGSNFTITFTNADGLGATLANLQLRASTQYIQHGPIEETSGGLDNVRVDVTDSVAAYGLRPWQGEMWPYIDWADMRDNLDVITTVKKDPRAWVRIGLNAEGSSSRNEQTATRDIDDRIRIVNSNPGVEFNEFCWIERIEHEVNAPEREMTYYECTPITGALGTNPYGEIDNNGAGVDNSDEGGSATGTGPTGSSGASSPSPIALYGFAAGNQLTTFNGVQRITGGDATNLANLVAAGADGAKILVDNAVSLTLTSQLVLASYAKLYAPHGGSFSLSGGSLAGAAIYLDGVTDVLIGNMNGTSAPGDYTSSNNPASLIEITGASDRIQLVGVTCISPTFGGAVTDAPEGINIWNNGSTAAAGPGSVTFYRCKWPVAGAGNSTAKSKAVIAGGTTTATRNALTFYECVFSAWQRNPFVQDGAIADIVNCVYPNVDRIDGIEVEDGGEVRARASVFRNTTDGSHEWETRDLGGGYIAAGPQSNDYQNGANFTEVSPTQVFTVPYTLTVNTTTYVDANVETNSGAGSVIIPE